MLVIASDRFENIVRLYALFENVLNVFGWRFVVIAVREFEVCSDFWICIFLKDHFFLVAIH